MECKACRILSEIQEKIPPFKTTYAACEDYENGHEDGYVKAVGLIQFIVKQHCTCKGEDQCQK